MNNAMIDTKTLAQQLGVSQTTILSRAKKLSLTPTEIANGQGRPSKHWSPDQARAIAEFGESRAQAQQAQAQAQEFSHQAEQGAELALYQSQSQLAASLQGQLGALDAQCSQVEAQMGAAIATRIAAVPLRSMGIAAQHLQTQGLGLDLSGFGAFTLAPTAAPTPAYLAWAADNSGIPQGEESPNDAA